MIIRPNKGLILEKVFLSVLIIISLDNVLLKMILSHYYIFINLKVLISGLNSKIAVANL
jgi:hypothetical protein